LLDLLEKVNVMSTTISLLKLCFII